MFLASTLVRDALKEEEKCDILKSPVNKKVHTVLLPKTFPTITNEEPLQWCYLDEPPVLFHISVFLYIDVLFYKYDYYLVKQIKKCECNQLNDLNLLDDTTQDNVLNILSKWHCTCGKKVLIMFHNYVVDSICHGFVLWKMSLPCEFLDRVSLWMRAILLSSRGS